MISHPKTGQPCGEVVRDKKIKFSGNNTSCFYLLNPGCLQIERIQVDGCAIIEGMRCDWMARTHETNDEEVFIELKMAAHIGKAVEQLEKSMKALSLGAKNTRRRCVVVFTRIRVTSTDIQNYKLRFKEKLKAEFKAVKNGDALDIAT